MFILCFVGDEEGVRGGEGYDVDVGREGGGVILLFVVVVEGRKEEEVEEEEAVDVDEIETPAKFDEIEECAFNTFPPPPPVPTPIAAAEPSGNLPSINSLRVNLNPLA